MTLSRREILKIMGAGGAAALAGCSSEKKTSEPDIDTEENSGDDDFETTDPPPDLEENDIYQDAERLVESIKEDMTEMERSGNSPFRAQVYLGGVNNYESASTLEFSVEDAETIESYQNMSESEILADLRDENVLTTATDDPVEIPLLLDEKVDLDLIYFQTRSEMEEEISSVATTLEDDLQGLLGDNYTVNTASHTVPVNQPPNVEDPEMDQEFSKYGDNHLKIAFTEAELDVEGFTYKDGDRAYIQLEPVHSVDTEKLTKLTKHEAYHSVPDLPHTAYSGNLLSLGDDSMDVSERNQLIAQRYASSEPDLTTEMSDGSMDITIDFQPQFQYDPEKDREDTFDHLETYLEEHKYFDTEPWRREEYDSDLNTARYRRKIDQGTLELYFNMDDRRHFENVELNIKP